ncbi:MAG: transglutaminase-like domain-containing protein [Defluviitaleaceae bacterium]|nr:transglutaminase-like domain-containing protein [Defluviitaleaceae bacterium]
MTESQNQNPKAKTWMDYAFCLLVGSVYLYAISRTIISATFIGVEQIVLYFMGLLSIVFFLVVLYNKYTRIAAGVFVIIGAAFIFFTLESFSEQYSHFYELFLMTTGRLPYRADLGQTAVWGITLLLGFAIVVFMFHQFNFYMLGVGGAIVFIFTWIPGFTRDETAFLFFLIAFCLILIRKTNKSMATVFAAAPLCLAVVLVSHLQMPHESELFVQRRIVRTGEGSRFMHAIEDFMFELFNPVHFSFQSTGFSGAGGRLGGPVTPNNRTVMTVQAPGRTYLAGAISNTYTGYSWIPTLQEEYVYTHGLPPAQFEMLETSVALIRYATHSNVRANIPVSQLWLSEEETRRVHTRQFPVLGIYERSQVDTQRMYIDETWQSVGMLDTLFETLEGATLGGSIEITDTDAIELVRDILFPSNEAVTTHEPVYINIPLYSTNRHYWHTYLPMATMTIALGTNRTGTIFRPPRMVDLWFYENAFNYAPYTDIHPTGTLQTPSFMSRGTAYHMQFLNVDTQLSFVEHLLQNAREGIYESYGENHTARTPTFMGYDFVGGGFYMHTTWVDPTQTIRLPQAPLDVAGLIAMLDFYAGAATAGNRTALTNQPRYITDADEFMHLLDSFAVDVLSQYAREVRQHFMEVPEVVPQRVFDLTHEIIANETTDFGRVMAIRDYLLQFPYTLNPVPVPRGVCFVDHFLFEGQEGYCTYFASAMAIMSRIAGVPSRYVEGFVLPPSADPNAAVTVTNRMAHAWVEVYLEGFGWHIMEATPTYAFLMNPDVPLPVGGAVAGEWIDHEWQEMMRRLMYGIDDEQAQNFFGPRPATTPTVIITPDEPEEAVRPLIIGVAFFVFKKLLLVAFFAIRRYQRKLKIRRINALPPNEQVKTYFHGILDIVTYYTNPLTPAETPKAYGKRMGKRFAFRSDSIFFRDLIALYYKAKYAPAQVSSDEIAIMQEAHKDMIDLLKDMRYRVVYLYLRYVKRVGEI